MTWQYYLSIIVIFLFIIFIAIPAMCGLIAGQIMDEFLKRAAKFTGMYIAYRHSKEEFDLQRITKGRVQ